MIGQLIKFVAHYDKMWSVEEARERLIKVLDNDGFAYGIFMKKINADIRGIEDENDDTDNTLEELYDNLEDEDVESQPFVKSKELIEVKEVEMKYSV